MIKLSEMNELKTLKKTVNISKRGDELTVAREFGLMRFMNRSEYILKFCENNNLKPIFTDNDEEFGTCYGFMLDGHKCKCIGWSHYNTDVYEMYFRII